jgi:hypothetical protein
LWVERWEMGVGRWELGDGSLWVQEILKQVQNDRGINKFRD